MPRRRERRPALVNTHEDARIGYIMLSGILPIMGGSGQEYSNCRRVTINTQVQKVYIYIWMSRLRRHVVKRCGEIRLL